MKRNITWGLLVLFITCAGVTCAADTRHRLGGGANYWVTLDAIDVDNVDEQGFSYLATYQYFPGFLGVELDVEFFPDRFGREASAPQAYLVLGQAIYAAAGVGVNYTDGEFAKDPFFGFRAGLNLELFPSLFLDISANYRFCDTSDIDKESTDIDTDTVFLGAALRFGF